MQVAGLTFMHLLVLVYWLGGDLGAFYASWRLTAPNASPALRLAAAKTIADIDMAPRTALILALPSGLVLAVAKGWLAMSWAWVFGVVLASLAWLAIAWRLHVTHGAGALRRVDLAIRWTALVGLGGAGAAGLAGWLALPAFIAAKLLTLAAAIALGLLIRARLGGFGEALAGLAGPAPEAAVLRIRALMRAVRPMVLGIWALLALAAFLGLWAPARL